MSNVERGAEIKRRRLAYGIPTANALAQAMRASGVKIDRVRLKMAEEGDEATRPSTYERIEAWLDAKEHEHGSEHEEAAEHASRGEVHESTTEGLSVVEMFGVTSHHIDRVVVRTRDGQVAKDVAEALRGIYAAGLLRDDDPA